MVTDPWSTMKDLVFPDLDRRNVISQLLGCLYPHCAQAVFMSSSYSSLDWVLSHWAHFTVFICVCLCVFVSYCIVVVLLWAWWGGPDEIKT